MGSIRTRFKRLFSRKKPLRQPQAPWKSAGEVESLSISDAIYGGGAHSLVRHGRIRFAGGKSKRVAVKVFDQPLNDEKAVEYQKAISDLRAAGVPLPKMGLVKLNNAEWVLVVQLYAKGGRTKLSPLPPLTKKDSVFCSRVLASVINAGYFPSGDIFDLLQRRRTAESMPLDLNDVINFKGAALEKKAWVAIKEIFINYKKPRSCVAAFVSELAPALRQQLNIPEIAKQAKTDAERQKAKIRS